MMFGLLWKLFGEFGLFPIKGLFSVLVRFGSVSWPIAYLLNLESRAHVNTITPHTLVGLG